MKTKAKIQVQVIRKPNDDTFIVQTQYVAGGAVFTYDNQGKGYTLEEANRKRLEFLNPDKKCSGCRK